MESATVEEIIQEVMGTSTDDDHDPDDSYSLPNVSTKNFFSSNSNLQYLLSTIRKKYVTCSACFTKN